MCGEVAGQKGPGSGAKDTGLPQPSGSTKACMPFPVDVEDDDDDNDVGDNLPAGTCVAVTPQHLSASYFVCECVSLMAGAIASLLDVPLLGLLYLL